MTPADLHHAVQAGMPLFIPAGCMEYHGGHLPIATDLLIAEELVNRIAARIPGVVGPSLHFGPTGYGCGSPRDGTMNMEPELYYRFAGRLFREWAAMGFSRLCTFQIHQPDGPMMQALKLAAADLEADRYKLLGHNWYVRGKDEEGIQSNCPTAHILYIVPPGTSKEIVPGDHAGVTETSLMLALRPEAVRLDRADQSDYRRWNRLAEASAERGWMMVETIVSGWADWFTQNVL